MSKDICPKCFWWDWKTGRAKSTTKCKHCGAIKR